MNNIVYGVLYGVLGQVISFLQLQASIKYGWNEKYLWIILLLGVPHTWFYMQSVGNIIEYFNGTLWESRLIGFCIGVAVFAVMGSLLFSEAFTPKTVVSLLLSLCIVLIQVLWR